MFYLLYCWVVFSSLIGYNVNPFFIYCQLIFVVVNNANNAIVNKRHLPFCDPPPTTTTP